MVMKAPPRLYTVEEVLAMPDDGVERWLIDGELRERPLTDERGLPMPYRSELHTEVMTQVAVALELWNRGQPNPRGKVRTGDVGVVLKNDPDTLVGADVVYKAPNGKNGGKTKGGRKSRMMHDLPTLVVEILSPSDTQRDIREKIVKYRKAAVPHVWLIDPYEQSVKVLRPNLPPVLLTAEDQLTAEPHLPGFAAAVADLFRD